MSPPTPPSELLPEDLTRAAKLAKLSFSEKELATLTQDLRIILTYMKKIQQAPVDGVEPFAYTGEREAVLAEDTQVTSLARDEALQNAPNKAGDFFEVPEVLAGAKKKDEPS